MEQEPSHFLQDALLPVMKGLIAEALFKHCNEDVRVTVASCLSEILRIASPVQPYNDDQMKAIFQLIVEALSKLSQPSTRSHEKALSMLETIARVKACLLMFDLECEAQILHMCQHFWVFTRLNPSADECWAVEQIMADILAESEDISSDLLIRLLDSVLKENEKVPPSSWKLGEKLILDCAAKLRPLKGALHSIGTTLDDYSSVVALLCQNESTTLNNATSGSPEHGIADLLGSKGSILPRKREPKPNSLMRPEEGYVLSWLYREGQTTEQRHKRRISMSRTDLSAMPTVSTINVETLQGEAALLPVDLRDQKMKLPTEGGNDTSKGTSRESEVLADGLIGQRIKVWWPLDEMFYDGRIESYNHITKKHKVLYDDADKEILNLEKERWEFIEDDLPDEHRQVAVNPDPITSSVVLRKLNGNERSFQSTKILNSKDDVIRAEATTGLLEVEEAPNMGNKIIGQGESSDDESSEDNVFEFRARSKDVQLQNHSTSTSDGDESSENNVFEFKARSKDAQVENPNMGTSDDSIAEASLPRVTRVRSKDVQLENPSTSTSNDSTPEASPPRAIRVRSKDVQCKNPSTSTSDDSTPEASPPRAVRVQSKDVQLKNASTSTSDDSTPEASPPRPWGLMRSQFRHR